MAAHARELRTGQHPIARVLRQKGKPVSPPPTSAPRIGTPMWNELPCRCESHTLPPRLKTP